MATTKKTEEVTEIFDPADRRVTVFLPPANDNEENFVLVGVNGEMCKIMRGTPVEIKHKFKAVLDNSRVAYKVLEKTMAKKASKNA